MLFPILLISFLVQVFSLSYMGEDPHVSRFYLYLNLFTFAMLILVTGDNWFTLFLGWEGVGLVSYLLVNFWFTRIDANHASLKAFLMNRVGDWGLTLGLLLWYVIFGDLTVNLFISNIHPDLIYVLGLLLF
jgi:NADH-ubiquinone oxidoreductase chain 5